MHWQYNPYVLPLLIAAAISAVLALFAWQRRPVPGATLFALLMLAVAEWSLGYALELGSADLPSQMFWARVEYLGIVSVSVMWLAFVFQYIGREKWLARRNVALLAIVPLVTLLLVWTNDAHGLIWSNIRLDTSGSFSVMDFTRGAWYWVNIAYSYLLLLLGTLLLLQALIRSPRLYRRQAAALVIGALAPWVGNALYVSGLSPFPHLDLTPFAFVLTGLAGTWGLFRYRLLDIVPVARDAVIESMSDGVIVLDMQNRIVALNPAAQRIIGRSAAEAIGQPAAQVLSGRLDLVEHYRDLTEAHEEIVLGEGEAQRYFGLRISPLYDRRGRLTGRLVVLRDITERKRAEEETRQRAEELAALYATSLDITARLELSDLLRGIIRRAAELLGASGGSLYLYRPEQDELELVVSHNLVADYTGIRLKVGEGLSGRVVATGRPLIVNDYRTWQGRASVYEEASFTVVIGVPLRWQERILGVINVTDLGERQPFDENDLHLLEAFAQQAAVALENARLHEGVRRQLEQLEVLYQVAEAGSRTLELQSLLQGLLDRILAVTGMQIGAIYQLNQATQQLHLLVHRGLSAEFVTRVKTCAPGQGITGRALASGQPTVCEDALDVPELHEKARLARFRSQISLPLKVAGKIIGVLNLNGKEPRTWPPGEMRWLEAVAGQVAIAMENAHLFEEIEERRLYLEGVLGAAPDAIVALDARYRIVEWNMGAERLFGYSQEEAVGQNIDDLVTNPDVLEEAVEFTQMVMGGMEAPPVETVRYRKDGSPVDVIVAGSPILVGEELIGVVAVYTDITERKRAEEALREAKDAAESADRAKSQFLARMSHEIRTPIHGIMGMTALVLNTELTREQREYLSIVNSSADSLMSIINDILDFSRIEARLLELEETDFDLRTTVEQTAEMMALRAHEKGLDLVCYIPPQVPTALVGDPGRLRQVLINLIGNAVKFTEQGEVVVQVEVEADRKEPVLSHALRGVEGEAEGEAELHFTVRDTGIGIAEDEQALIFEVFRQADGSTTRRYGGTGLGLAISQQLVELMGGRIWVESRLGEGSTFHFTAKLKKQTRARPAVVVDLQGLPALVIDDNATNRFILREMLSHWGLVVTEAEDGIAGLRELERASPPFRLVLLDRMMPWMDGFAVAEQIRDDPVLKDVTVMMLSSDSVHNDTARCRELGIATYLVKPIKQSEFLDAILTVLGTAPQVEKEPEQVIPVAIEGPQLRILLAEDNFAGQLIARKTLGKMGHSVQVAGNGLEVLQILEEGDFDLVLMDVEMPEMDGLEATRTIREREAESGQHIPILAMTAYAMKEDQERCLEAGMDGYISKPVSPDGLHRAIESFLSLDRGLRAADEPPPAPAVDLEAALRAVGGDRELLQEAVGLFVELDYPRHLGELKAGLAQQDARAVKRAAHGIKGALRSFGGELASDVALRLETMGREGNLTGAQSVLEELEAEVKQFAVFFERKK